MLNNYKKIIIITFSEININSDSATTYGVYKIFIYEYYFTQATHYTLHIKDMDRLRKKIKSG